MPSCGFHKICAFFQNEMDYMPGTAGLYRRKYCMDRPGGCARHMVYSAPGAEAVPGDLYPYQQDRARDIIAACPAV
jgi:hypothetical protein